MGLIGGAARVNFLWNLASGQAVSNTFYVSKPGGGSAPDLTELTNLATDLDTWFTTTMRSCFTTTDTFTAIRCFQVPDPLTPVPPFEVTRPIGLAGTIAVTRTTPQSAAFTLNFTSSLASRSTRGHIQLEGLPQNTALAGDFWSAGALTPVTNLAAKFAAGKVPGTTWTGSTLSNYVLTVFSKKLALGGSNGLVAISAVTLSPRVRWQRSRERGTT